MAKRVDRIVVDTNLWISFLISKDFKKLDERIRKGKVRLVFSVELIDEFLTVADRPKFRKFFSKAEVASWWVGVGYRIRARHIHRALATIGRTENYY